MSLLQNWRDIAYNQEADKKQLQQFWTNYFLIEKNIYEQLLSNPDEVVKGTVKELAEKYKVDVMTMVGFLDGINDSLVIPNPIEEMEEDTVVTLAYDKELLYKNMVDAKADWLYNLPQWDEIFTEEKKKEFREMKLDYPQIINKFNLYIKSGMTIRKAWFKIAGEYEKDQKEKEQISAKACGRKKAYEEMVNVMYKISGGASEGECYEEYGIRCNLSEYRKFGMMLSQNLRKGTRGLTELLEREAEDAFEQRKNLAKKAGEEAGTKLMIPLFLMLIIVFAIVIVPAFFSIRI